MVIFLHCNFSNLKAVLALKPLEQMVINCTDHMAQAYAPCNGKASIAYVMAFTL